MKNYADMLNELTLEEKIAMIHGAGLFRTGGVPRLNIPPLYMSDGPNGIRQEFKDDSWEPIGDSSDYVSWLPSNTCLTSTWNPEMAYYFGQVLGAEARGRGKDVVLAPGINIKRTPLCGRNFEYMSEDPCLTSYMASSLIQGIQENDVAACVKHFALNNQEMERMSVEAEVDEVTLRELYLPAFHEAVITSNALSIMPAYNRYNGSFCCECEKLLQDILRKEWRYTGLSISDWGAVHNTDEVALHGVDVEMSVTPDFDNYKMAKPLYEKVKNGEIPEQVIDEKVFRILNLMNALRIGHPDRKKGCINAPEHAVVLQNIAEEGIVLLKNDKNHLPLTIGDGSYPKKKILVVGDNAVRCHANGGGSSEVKALYDISPMLGIRMVVGGNSNITWLPGYYVDNENHVLGEVDWQAESLNVDYTKTENALLLEETIFPKRNEYKEAVLRAIPDYDEVIFVGGLNHAYDVEGFDRQDMKLPYGQDDLISAMADATDNLTVVLIAGSPVEMPWVDKVHALIQTSYCGMRGGHALAKIIFGETNPSGKLTETYPISLDDTPPSKYDAYPGEMNPDGHRHVAYKEGLMVGYRYYTSKNVPVLFPFGHGLSYSTFHVSNQRVVVRNLKSIDEIQITLDCEIQNTSNRAGKETLQLYVGLPGKNQPKMALKAFEKVSLEPTEKKDVALIVTKKSLAVYCEEENCFKIEPGCYHLYLGTSASEIIYHTTVDIMKQFDI